MNYAEAQLEHTKALIILWQTEILSGAYKQKKLFHGGASTTGPETAFTDDEKLEHCMEVLKRHVSRVYELTEQMAEDNIKAKSASAVLYLANDLR